MKFRYKTMLCIVIALSLAYAFGGSLLVMMSFDSALESRKKSAIEAYQVICNTITVNREASVDYKEFIDTIHRVVIEQEDSSTIGAVLYADSEVVYSSGHIPFEAPIEINNDSNDVCHIIGPNLSYSYTTRESFYYLMIRGYVPLDGAENFTLDLYYDVSEVYRATRTQIVIYIEILSVLIVVGIVVSWAISKFLTKPLDTLSKTSKGIADGYLTLRAVVNTNDEFGLLADNFNLMADSLENYIEQLKDEMERREKFMASFAHEIKTPMTSIIGYSDLIRCGALSADEIPKAANYIFSESKRLEKLSLKLLDLIVLKKRDFEFKKISISQTILDTAKAVKPKLISNNISFFAKCEEGECFVEPDLFKSLIINLIDNASKAVDNKGGIIKLYSEMTENGCIIKILDNGRGIPQEDIDKISQAFYRVDKSRSRKYGGAGLGLSLCSEIVAMHNGTIDFESELGKGTCVTVVLNGGKK